MQTARLCQCSINSKVLAKGYVLGKYWAHKINFLDVLEHNLTHDTILNTLELMY